MASVKMNAPVTVFMILFQTCIAILHNLLTNKIVTNFVEVVVISVFVTKQVIANIKICKHNTDAKDVIVSFFCPPVLC